MRNGEFIVQLASDMALSLLDPLVIPRLPLLSILAEYHVISRYDMLSRGLSALLTSHNPL